MTVAIRSSNLLKVRFIQQSRLDHKISNQRKVVTEGDKSSVVNNPTGRKRHADSKK